MSSRILTNIKKLSFEDEKARVENLLIVMNKTFGRGIIEVVGPTKNARQKLMKRATRAKKYLIKQHGLESERLLLVDVGFNESAITRLSLYAIGGLGSRVYLFPKQAPENAKPRKVR